MGFYIYVEENIKIYVEEINPGGRETVLFLHGWPLDHNAYEYQLNHLPKLGVRCFAMDTRGFGLSDKPWDGYGYDRLADDVYAVINAIGLQNCMLVGHSMGGAIAVRYMARYDGYGVKKLVLLGAAVPSFVKRTNFSFGLPGEQVTELIKQSLNDRPQMLRNFGELFLFQYATEPLKGWFFDMGIAAAGWSTAACLVTLRDECLFADMKRIHAPTMIMHGIHDRVCLFPLAVAMKEGIRSSKLVPFEYSGHGLFWEEWGKLNAELERFLSE